MRLIHAGLGVRRWEGDGGYVSDGERVWRLRDGAAARFPDAEQAWFEGEELVVVGRSRWLRLGKDVTRGVGPPGPVHLWAADGFLYRTDHGRVEAIDVLDRGERFVPGPGGAVVVGGDLWTRAARPGRSVHRLPQPLAIGSETWSADGNLLDGVSEADEAATIDLRTGAVVSARPRDVPPCGTSARSGDRLAGPGGRVWSLTHECAVGEAGVIPLGVVVPCPSGFVAIDWETNRGWTVPYDQPRRTLPFILPIDEDDTPVAGRAEGDAALVRTALGEVFAVADGRVERAEAVVPDRPDPIVLATEVGPFPADGVAEIGGVRYAWNDDGWWVALGPALAELPDIQPR